MARHNELGKKGEDLAVAHLLSRGYRILARNWHYGHAEIDILAEKEGFLVVIEVKTRTSDAYGKPEMFVNRKKINLLKEAVNAFMEEKNLDLEVRFDIISVISNRFGNQIEHIENAFYWY